VAGAVLLPFVVWDASSFFDDTVLYLTGATAYSYPIRGWGISAIFRAVNIIPSADSSFPFSIIELLVGLPTLALLLRWQWRENTLQAVWFGFAVLSFVIEYFSRFFNDNYFVFILQALVIGSFILPYRWERTAQTDPTA
jgi:hypothetical protein